MKRFLKFTVAAAAVAAIAVFVLLNLGHQAKLRLFRELEINTLLLLVVAFSAGAAAVFLADLWRHCKRGKSPTTAAKVQAPTMDEDL
ncbi:MAG TPA: hypothetical protein HPP83_12205 [Candidatus Hydrogenedentes bacterium]|nr:hypothetical protein [Candidatus Hydrogenedentota bacterium]